MHFNSQPHKEADTFQLSQVHTQWYFNSQPHKEADEYSPKKLKFVRYFNSQPHKEADFYLWQKESDSHISTHSLTRRLTLRRLTLLWFRIYFNSQPHKEADLTALPIPLIAPIFQLTASQGG